MKYELLILAILLAQFLLVMAVFKSAAKPEPKKDI